MLSTHTANFSFFCQKFAVQCLDNGEHTTTKMEVLGDYGIMELWNYGIVELWNSGIEGVREWGSGGLWNCGIMELWNCGIME